MFKSSYASRSIGGFDDAARLAVEGAPTIRERWASEAVKRCQTVETADLSWVPGISNDKGGVNTFPSLVVTRAPAPASMYANDNVPGQPARPGPGAYLHGPHDVEYKLDCLPRGLVYLGSPYSLYKHGLHIAARHASRAAAALMRRGLVVYAPISHGHAIASDNALPATWEFWKAQCQPYIDAAAALVVLKLEGWEESVGLTYEIEEFGRHGKPIVFVAPEDLAFKEETIEEEWKRKVG